MRKTLTQITTYDTKKTYEYPSEEEHPQLWQVTLSIISVDHRGYVPGNAHKSPSVIIYLERETLMRAGLLPQTVPKAMQVDLEETPEELLHRLLESLGYFPTE